MTIHLHLGAHKTGSTHLQAVMRKNRHRLREAGTVYAPPDQLRDLIGPAQRAAAAVAPLPSLRAMSAARALARLADGAPKLLIAADENGLGHCGDMIRARRLYPEARARLGLWHRAARARDLTCFLAIRDYAAFFASVHIQSVRDGPLAEMKKEDRIGLAALPRRWPDLVAEIRRALPGARLVMWEFDDYEALRETVARRLSGQEGLKPVLRRSMQTPSIAAWAALQVVAAGREDRRVPKDVFRAVMADHPVTTNNPRYAPWATAEAARMTVAYHEDVAALRADAGIEFLTP
ncbi:MAG: hypothetical protein AAF367_13650 [Pseudomonadota bacterium]